MNHEFVNAKMSSPTPAFEPTRSDQCPQAPSNSRSSEPNLRSRLNFERSGFEKHRIKFTESFLKMNAPEPGTS